LACTPDHDDGSWYTICQHGVFVADVRTVADLERWVSLADLEPDGLALAFLSGQPSACPPSAAGHAVGYVSQYG
jgi:hypothetical protein